MKGIYFRIIGIVLMLLGVIGGLYIGFSTHSFLSFFGIMVGAAIEAMLFLGIGAILDKLDSFEQNGNSPIHFGDFERQKGAQSGSKPITPTNALMKHISGLELHPNETVKVYPSDERIAFVKGSYTKVIRAEDVVFVASGLKNSIEEVPGFDKEILNDTLYYFIIRYESDNGYGYIVLNADGNESVADSFKKKIISNQLLLSRVKDRGE